MYRTLSVMNSHSKFIDWILSVQRCVGSREADFSGGAPGFFNQTNIAGFIWVVAIPGFLLPLICSTIIGIQEGNLSHVKEFSLRNLFSLDSSPCIMSLINHKAANSSLILTFTFTCELWWDFPGLSKARLVQRDNGLWTSRLIYYFLIIFGFMSSMSGVIIG